MNFFKLKSVITREPNYPVELENTISVEHKGSWYLVGDQAAKISLDPRGFHGSFKNDHYKILFKAAVAYAQTENKRFKTSIQILAPEPSINEFRDIKTPRAMLPSQIEMMKDCLKEIKFKKESTKSEENVINVDLDQVTILHELNGVLGAIPSSIRTFSVVHIGYGDLQMVCIRNGMLFGKVERDLGIYEIIKSMSSDLKISLLEAQDAFISESFYDQTNFKEKSAVSKKRKAVEQYVAAKSQVILNILNQAHIDSVIISGGSIKDEMLMAELEQALRDHQIVTNKIHQLENSLIKDPSFCTIQNLAQPNLLVLDIGNSEIKGVIHA